MGGVPDGIQATCVACLSCELVSERHGVVCSVPHPGGRLPEGDAGCIQQARVGSAQCVPSHAGMVERTHGVDEGFAGASVVAPYWQIQALKQKYGALAERYDAETLESLWLIDPAVPVDSPADAEEMPIYVAWLNGYDLTPSQAREQNEFSDASPHARHTLDDLLDVLEREGVLTGLRRRDAWATEGER